LTKNLGASLFLAIVGLPLMFFILKQKRALKVHMSWINGMKNGGTLSKKEQRVLTSNESGDGNMKDFEVPTFLFAEIFRGYSLVLIIRSLIFQTQLTHVTVHLAIGKTKLNCIEVSENIGRKRWLIIYWKSHK
ncbi:hypothetical protein KKC44_05515, partial [Patescibacteria group bacterium]|nr:hypothetical protein [Patescibacteria group bacterium]